MASTKSKILTLLEQNRGQTLSGAAIAESLDLSRSAIWKTIEELRKEGYVIDAVTNRGYSLTYDSDILSTEGLLHWVSNPLMKKDNVLVYKTIGSTNQEAKKLAAAGAGHGTVILAEEQTEGRGRRGRSFFSPKGTGLYMSVILRPGSAVTTAGMGIGAASAGPGAEPVPASSAANLGAELVTAAAAVAVCRALNHTLKIKAKIKWVNDIFIEDRKVCGILAEALSDMQTGSIECIILGIGLNVFTKQDCFPDEIRRTAGTLAPETSVPFTRNQLAASILDELLDLLQNGSKQGLIEEYRALCFIPGKPITVHKVNESYDAIALDIDPECGLVVRKIDGSTETLRSGEVSIRQKPLTGADKL